MTSGDSCFHASFTQFTMVSRDGARGLPAGVKSVARAGCCSHCSYSTVYAALNGAFQLTSAGCSNFVHPPGITPMIVLVSLSRSFDSSVM